MADRVLGGRYQVLDKVGTGGMATVYRGMDRVLGRTVAIKTMLPQYATDPSFAARFKQEAQAAAALNSPYIVSVYDWGKDGDTYYIIMEYLRGTDLKSGIRKHGALDCKKVAQIGSRSLRHSPWPTTTTSSTATSSRRTSWCSPTATSR